jgi:transposase
MEPMLDFAQLQLHFVDHVQWRYEVVRPLVLFDNRTAVQRAEETQTHPDTVRKLTRRFRQRGILGLFPEQTEIISPSRSTRVPEAVVEEIARLKALYGGFQYRELARIIWYKLDERIDDKTVKKLWQHSPTPVQGELPLGVYHSHADRYHARLQVIKLYYQGWNKLSISRFLRVSRPTVDRWIHRFEAEHFAGLADKSRAPKSTTRKVWFPLMIAIYHLQKRHPDAGEFRIWSLLASDTISVRTVGRVMALNKQVYDDIPHTRKNEMKKPPQPHPYKAIRHHHIGSLTDG